MSLGTYHDFNNVTGGSATPKNLTSRTSRPPLLPVKIQGLRDDRPEREWPQFLPNDFAEAT